MSAINKMGVELEGAWKGTRGVSPFKDARIKHDGSVAFSQTFESYLHYGEIVSDPLDPSEIVKWARDHCPTDANDTAGTHCHVSLKNNGMYGSILTPGFQRHLISKLREHNETIKESDKETYLRFKKRLAGNNRYCLSGYKGLSQVAQSGRGGDRYHQVNYCFRLHGTVEVRVLPCTTNKQFLGELIEIVRDTIEDWVAREHVTRKVRFRRG